MENFRNRLTLFFSALALLIVGFGIYEAMHSSLFLIENIEIVNSVDVAPIDEDTLLKQTGIRVGKQNLFELDQRQVEERLLLFNWIKEVRFQRKLPKTLVVAIGYRVPRAIFQRQKGNLIYVDADGSLFGSVQLKTAFDLPILSGIAETDENRLLAALKLLEEIQGSDLMGSVFLSSIYWDADRGFSALVSYPSGTELSAEGSSVRTLIRLGHEIEEPSERLNQLNRIFQYLGEHSIVIRHLWADLGKKVVVKTVRGS